MRTLAALFALSGTAAALFPAAGPTWNLIVTGDTDGYLSPCGCTQPMSGGIRRRVTAIRTVAGTGPTAVVDNGWFVADIGRQSVLKAETLAQVLQATDTVANVSALDARLGGPELQQLDRLSGERLVSGTGAPRRWIVRGPMLIGGATVRPQAVASAVGGDANPPETVAHALVAEADAKGLLPVLLTDGSLQEARAVAKAEPKLRVVVFRQSGRPPSVPDRQGDTVLVSPGEHGKQIVRLTVSNGKVGGYAVQTLGPEVADDPDATRYYRAYLRRVEGERLLERVDRRSGPEYAGTSRCGSCHAQALAVWRGSGHAHALKSLKDDGHGKDPECVVCHVVGLAVKTGYRSEETTPDLANVGCESCHGAGAAHAAAPKASPVPKVGESACLPCHTTSNSPNFDFSTYWPKVRHR